MSITVTASSSIRQPEVRHQLGIGVPRRRYIQPVLNVHDITDELGLA